MLLKPHRWNVSSGLVQPNAAVLWKGVSFVFPAFSGAHLGGSVLLGANGRPLPGVSLVAGSTAEKRITPYGLGVGISGASNLLQQDNLELITTSDGAGTGDFTILALANPISEARVSFAVSQTSTSNVGTYLQFNATGNISSPVAGAVALRTREGSSSTDVSATSILDGNYHLFIVTRTGTTLDLWVDGILRGSNTSTLRDITDGTLGFAIGQRAEATNFRLDTACNIVLAGGWNRSLLPYEIKLLTRDPFIMLRSYSLNSYLGYISSSETFLTPSNLSLLSSLASAGLTQNHNLIGQNLAIASSLASAGLTQEHILAVSALLSAPIITTPTLTQNHILSPTSLSVADLLGTPSLTAGVIHTLSPADLLSALSLTAPALSQIFPDSRNFVNLLQLLAPYDINQEFIAWVETNFTILKEGIELLKTLNVEGLNTISGAVSGTHKLIVFDPTTNEPKVVTKSDFLL